MLRHIGWAFAIAVLVPWLGAVAAPACGSEPAGPACVILVQGNEAVRCLALLGKDCVRLVVLSEDSDTDRGWTDLARRETGWLLPAAVVVGPCGDDLPARFWRERLGNQQPIEVLALTGSAMRSPGERRHCSLRQAHALLVKLCPESKEMLDERLTSELRRLQAAMRSESIASR
jgi:hypothetical protein